MRYILTNNSHVQFIEADDNGKILKSRGFEFGGVYYQIANNKVTFYLKDQDQPWVNNVWSADIPLMINGEVYSTPEEVGVQLSTIMTDGNIADKIAELESDIAEIVGNESALTDSLDAEIERATSAETEISEKVDELETALDEEILRSTEKDTEHDVLISGLTDNLSSEISRATSAETEIANDLDAEIARAEAAEEDLDDKIDAEITRANAEETRIEGLINAEVTRSTAKDAAQDALISGLTNSLNNEINRAQGAENSLRSDLNNEVSARTTADAAQLQRITALEVGKANASDVYTKAESDAKYATKEYISGNTYTKAETDALIADFYDGVQYDSNAKRINFMHGNAIKSYIDASAFIKDGMVDNVVIENGYLVITFNTDAGKEAISIPLSDIFDPTNYYTKNEVDASQLVQDNKINAISGDVTTLSGDVATLNEKVETISGDVQTISGDVQTISGNVQTISGNVQTISGDVQVLDGKIDTLSGNIVTLSGEVQTIQSETVTISGEVNTLSGEVQTIQSEIDDIDLSNYYEKTEVDDLLDDKLDASAYTPTDLSNYYTKNEVDASQSVQDTKITALSGDVQTISGNVQTISGEVNALSGEVQTIQSEIDDIDLSNYYTKSESDDKYQLKGDYVTGAQLSAFTYDKATIDEKVAEGGHFDPTQYYTTGQTDALLDEKLDVTAYTPTDLSDYWTSAQTQSVITQATSGLQETLSAGTNIDITDNVISVTGTSIVIDPSLDSGSTNAVANSAITETVNDIKNNAVDIDTFEASQSTNLLGFNYSSINNRLHGSCNFAFISDGLTKTNTNYLSVNFTSAITSASTDVQVPSAKAVYNVLNDKQDTLTAGSGISIINNVISATGGSTPIDAYTKAESDAKFATITNLNSHSGNTNMHVTAAEKSTWNNKSDFSGDYNDLINQPTEVSTFNNDAGYITINDLDEYPTTEDVVYLIGESVSGKQDTLIAGSGISIVNNVISATGGGSITVDSALDSGSTNPVQNKVLYNKIDEVEQVTAAALNNLNDALNDKQDTLSAGTGISIQGNVISATGGSTPIDAYTKAESDAKFATISNFNSHTANTAIHVTTAQTASWDAKSNFSGSYNDLTDKPTIPTVPTSNTAFTNDAGYITSAEAQSAITAATSGLQETLSAGTNVSITNNVISATDTTYTAGDNITISNQNVISTVTKFWCGTQAEYDLIQNKDSNTVYMIHE